MYNWISPDEQHIIYREEGEEIVSFNQFDLPAREYNLIMSVPSEDFSFMQIMGSNLVVLMSTSTRNRDSRYGRESPQHILDLTSGDIREVIGEFRCWRMTDDLHFLCHDENSIFTLDALGNRDTIIQDVSVERIQ